jgi:hypothetical protein
MTWSIRATHPSDLAPEISMKRATIIITTITLLCLAAAQDPFAMQRELQKNLADDKNTTSEIDRIHGLTTPSNPALLTRQLDEAQTALDGYAGYLNSEKSLKDKLDNLQAKQQEAVNNIEALSTLGKNCKNTKNFDPLDTTLISLRAFFESIGFNLSFGFVSAPQFSNPSDAEVATKVSKLLVMEGREFCKNAVDNQVDMNRMKQEMVQSIALIKTQTEAQINDFEKKKPRAQQLLKAWSDRKTELEKSLEQKSGTATTVANYLPWIILAFCAFALLIFIVLMRFPEPSQLELIASGQVIQFATIIILLIVICILGMAKFIADSTLGTLLGGISGYVLSQGVGRKERHEAAKVS